MSTHVACNLMSASKRELLDAFHAASKRLLGDAGWRKRSGGIYTCDLGNGFHAWLGLNRSTKYRPVAIDPVAGLRYEPLERLMRELSGLRGQATNATLAQSIGYIGDASPQSYVQLFIGGLDEAGPAAAELARLAERHALPFARQHASVAALERALREGKLVGHRNGRGSCSRRCSCSKAGATRLTRRCGPASRR